MITICSRQTFANRDNTKSGVENFPAREHPGGKFARPKM